MKKLSILSIILLVFVITSLSLFVYGSESELTEDDKSEMISQVELLIKATNDNDMETIDKLISKKIVVDEKVIENMQVIDYHVVKCEQYTVYSRVEIIANITQFNKTYKNQKIGFTFNEIDQFYYMELSNLHTNRVEIDRVNDEKAATYGTISLFFIPLWGIAMIIGLALFVFWIQMFIDAIKRDFENHNDKIIWIIVLITCNNLGAILYYFLIKKSN